MRAVAAGVLCLALLTGCGPTDTAGSRPAAPVKSTAPSGEKVSRVVDGDTIKLESGVSVRLIGIDTPERGQCNYAKAKAHLKDLIGASGVTLTAVKADGDKDRYGRLLRYVAIAGKDAGLDQIESGLAIARYDSRDGYARHPKQSEYIAADARVPQVAC